jgi:hypothetical protein
MSVTGQFEVFAELLKKFNNNIKLRHGEKNILKQTFLLFNPGGEVSLKFLRCCLKTNTENVLSILDELEGMGLIQLENGSFICTCLDDCNRKECSSVSVEESRWALTLKGVELRLFSYYSDIVIDILLNNS